MPKWAERAKSAMARQGDRQFQRASLKETIKQGASIIDHIRFVMESSGAATDGVELSPTGLDRVEAFYRSAMKAGGNESIELGSDNFERLMAVMLGQCIVGSKDAKWAVYEGQHHVLDPVVVQLNDGKHADVFMFCRSLSQKSGVAGANRGQALSSYLENAERMAFP
jgi:hypothetical protein